MKRFPYLITLAALIFMPLSQVGASTSGPVWLYARLKHDDPPRTVLPISPETVTLQQAPKGSLKGPAITINLAWQNFDATLNTPAAFKWLLMPSAALVNTPWGGKKLPHAESISFGGNVVIIDYITGNYGHIRSYGNTDTPPSPDVMNYDTYPQYIQKITTINRHSGAIGNPGQGLDVYFMLLHSTDLWVSLDKLEFFPSLPITVRPKVGVALRVRSGPSTTYPQIGGLYPYQTATANFYVPRGSSVWAQITLEDGTQGYAALMFNGEEFTSWHMKTVPPVPPK